MRPSDGGGRLGGAWGLFVGLSLSAVLIGCWVVSAHGAPNRAWLPNIVAWAVGAALAGVLWLSKASLTKAWLIVALLGLMATFLGSGLLGVHRWASLGPIHLNAAELLLPPAVVGLAALNPGRGLRLLFALAALSLLALQPDASQAVALAGGILAVVLLARGPLLLDVLTGFVCAALAGLACLRPDPLGPVAEVEGVIGLAATLSPVAAGAAVLALAGAVLSPLAVTRGAPTLRPAAISLCALLALAALAPLSGAFPVPLVGRGVSPILGAWLGFGALIGASRPRRARPPS